MSMTRGAPIDHDRIEDHDVDCACEACQARRALISRLDVVTLRTRADSARTVVFAQGHCETMLGLTAENLVTTEPSFLALIHPEDQGHVAAELQQALLGGDRVNLSYRLQPSPGSERWVWEQGSVVRDDHGRPTALLTSVVDISDMPWVKSQERLEQLAAGVAHDLRNLLTVLTASTQMLERHVAATSPLHRQVDRIISVADEAATLASGLLGIARRRPFRLQPVDLNELLIHATVLLEEVVGPSIELTLELDPELGAILANRSQLEQVVLNLVGNARDAMPDGGELTLATRHVVVSEADEDGPSDVPPGAYVCLSVADTGVGIPDSDLQRVFQPYYSTKPGSVGLGLATIRQIVAGIGGSISVESQRGIGARFRVLIPRTGERAAARVSGMVPKR